MAAGLTPKPGTEYAPCVDGCAHRDCAETRQLVAATCTICDKLIGWEVRYYRNDDGQPNHARCVEKALARIVAQKEKINAN